MGEMSLENYYYRIIRWFYRVVFVEKRSEYRSFTEFGREGGVSVLFYN